MREQCRCVMCSESNRIVWDGRDCPLHYDQEATMAEDAAQATIKELRRDLALAQGEAAYLRRENDRLGRVLRDSLLLEALEAAWEAAEVPTASAGIRAGDVCIELCADHHFEVFRAAVGVEAGGRWEPAVRILSRAPRQPWADLADALVAESVVFDSEDASIAARALHSAGVRMTGGGES